METLAPSIDDLWKESFPEVDRPQLYTSDNEDEHGFLPINDSSSFSEDTTNLTTKQLYTLGSNNQIALKQAQDEYLELEAVIRRISGKDPKRDPRALPSQQEFQGRNEAILYSYKYQERNSNLDDIVDAERRDIQHFQEPFTQGGFVPTAKQYTTKVAKAADRRNPDGWKPVEKDGKKLIPKLQGKHEEYVRHPPWTQEDIDAARAGSADAEHNHLNGTPSKAIDKRLTRTRYDGQKVPPTRDVSEDPSHAPSPRQSRAHTPRNQSSRPMTPIADDGSPVPRKRQRVDTTVTTASSSTFASNRTTPAPGQGPPRQRARPSQPSMPPTGLSPRAMRNWKWTTETLIRAIQDDYLWLHPDPVKALLNKDKLLAAANPVRTWSMCNKWIDWHEKGLDKRPRNKDAATTTRAAPPLLHQISQQQRDSLVPAPVASPMVEMTEAVLESVEGREEGLVGDDNSVNHSRLPTTPRPNSRVSVRSSDHVGMKRSGNNTGGGGSPATSRKNSSVGLDTPVRRSLRRGVEEK